MSSNKTLTIDPGERWHLFSQSALDELIANEVKAELEKAAGRAWAVLIGQAADWSVRQLVTDAIRNDGNFSNLGSGNV